ncbi:hypothetical protein DZA28_29480 [Pseudomonas alloputida]|nr:Hypothetical protein [Pseudomonas fluorescens]OAS26902.1 hypothetical protein AYO08_22990 [Pseudomonas putida]RMQ19564.1 hypothetical protein ALQ08_01836 [Pseudomonas syringae pv. delphinii]TRZ57413.1 hypothetical protein DZA28_29480 [Pseudomonas alloputida]
MARSLTPAPADIVTQGVDGLDVSQEFGWLRYKKLLADRDAVMEPHHGFIEDRVLDTNFDRDAKIVVSIAHRKPLIISRWVIEADGNLLVVSSMVRNTLIAFAHVVGKPTSI